MTTNLVKDPGKKYHLITNLLIYFIFVNFTEIAVNIDDI